MERRLRRCSRTLSSSNSFFSMPSRGTSSLMKAHHPLSASSDRKSDALSSSLAALLTAAISRTLLLRLFHAAGFNPDYFRGHCRRSADQS